MKSTKTMTEDAICSVEEDISIRLIGTREEVKEALLMIDKHFRVRISSAIRQLFPGLPSQDLADVWGETLKGIYEAVQKQRFDPDKGRFLAWIYNIAYNKACDLTRRRESHNRFLDTYRLHLKGSQVGREFNMLGKLEQREALALIRQMAGQFPHKQRIVFEEYIDGFPETEDMKVLKDRVSVTTGTEETIYAVKSALQESRRKIREYLAKRGYIGNVRMI